MKKIIEKLKKSPINYFSDLFIVAMVVLWIVTTIVMIVVAIFATVVYADTYMWSDVANLVAIPLSCGGAIWMIKNSVQHAIMNNQGKECPQDFPAVDESTTIDGQEQVFETEEGIG